MLAQLQQLGLSEKEAKVYLATLELGSSSVQEIARKAGINRPTTYFQIENLIKMGLMSSVTRGTWVMVPDDSTLSGLRPILLRSTISGTQF